MNRYYFIMLLVALQIGCKSKSFDGTAIGKSYCECMEKNGARNDYYNARVICDSKFILDNRFFRMYYIESMYGRYTGTLEKATVDSSKEFIHAFFMEVSERCPYVYKEDSIADVYLKKQR